MIETDVNGLPVIMTEFGYKTFSMVVKSIGYFTRRASPTYWRTEGVMEACYGQPYVGPGHPSGSAAYIVDLYKSLGRGGFETLVFSPGLELACYLGRVLDAPVLPTQFIAAAPDLSFVTRQANDENIYFVGHETDWPNLCLWIKPLDLYSLYGELLRDAKQVIILSMDCGRDNRLGTPCSFQRGNIVINGIDGGDNYAKALGDPVRLGYRRRTQFHLPHWEFAMDQAQISNMEKACRLAGKRVAVVRFGDWGGFIPAVAYAEFFARNGVRPTGTTFHAYWACHPYYEAEFGRVPIWDFQYGADQYVAEFGGWLNSLPFEQKDGEYLVWSNAFNKLMDRSPIAHFERWGFRTTYRTERPYDVWRYARENIDDLRNPTREWVVPRLQERGGGNREFKHFLAFDDVLRIAGAVRKCSVTVG